MSRLRSCVLLPHALMRAGCVHVCVFLLTLVHIEDPPSCLHAAVYVLLSLLPHRYNTPVCM